ncbi:hypothetical protein GUI12_00485 [Anaplasmataceae bacterium AB001_6]|nr:hypothetical protein GUI12_00485 [Anaplasmataceae bacterium AB001_6]
MDNNANETLDMDSRENDTWAFDFDKSGIPGHLFAGCRDDNEEPKYILSTKINGEGNVVNRYLFVAENNKPADDKPVEEEDQSNSNTPSWLSICCLVGIVFFAVIFSHNFSKRGR